MNKTNDKLRAEVLEKRKKGLTYYDISRLLNISPQRAHYYGKELNSKT